MRFFDIRRHELPALAWAAGWFFCVLAAYYTIRPVREMFASELSRDQRATLFTLTLLVMLVATPLYGLVVARLAKRWLVLAVYGFFIACLIGFWGVISAGEVPAWFPGAFFVWISVFNLFVVTLFWGTIVDLFNGGQGKRLFGLIFGAGTLGQLTGSWAVQAFTGQLGMSGLLWVCATLLSVAMLCSWQLRRLMPSQTSSQEPTAVADQNSWSLAWQGVTEVARSPFLLGIAAFIVTLSICATVAYFQMTDIVAEQLPDSKDRLRWFAKINATHAVVTLLLQTAVVGWLLRKIGVGMTMVFVPVVLCLGFASLAFTQTLFAVGAFQVALRASAFSLGSPALEVLFTAVAPEQKYRAKSFIDTVGKRTGDVLGAQAYAAVGSLGWLASTMSLAMLPIALGLVVLCILLGSAHQQATSTERNQTTTGTGN